VKSSNPAVARVAASAVDVATDSIVVNLVNGIGNFNYFVAGIEDTTGQVSITARAPGFTDASAVANVVKAGVEIQSLATTHVAGGVDDPFIVRVGVPNGTQTSLSSVQIVRPGSPGITVSLTSGNPSVGQLVTTALTGGTVSTIITALNNSSAALVSNGGVAFRPTAAGTSVVTASAPGFTTMTSSGNITTTVNSP
jgi:hypothetical protein